MATEWRIRLVAYIPAASRNGFNTWWKNNIDPKGGQNTFTVGVSATGSAPATAYITNTALTLAMFKAVAQRIIALVNNVTPGAITMPGDWDTLTKTQKIQWFQSQRGTVYSNIGVYYRVLANDEKPLPTDWADVLGDHGLQVIASGGAP